MDMIQRIRIEIWRGNTWGGKAIRSKRWISGRLVELANIMFNKFLILISGDLVSYVNI
jgi:hypothetical protein